MADHRISEMSYEEFKGKLKDLGYSFDSFSEEIGMGRGGVYKWRSKGVPKWAGIYLETKIQKTSTLTDKESVNEMSYRELKRKLKSLGYSIISFAKESGICPQTISRWKKTTIPQWVKICIEAKIKNGESRGKIYTEEGLNEAKYEDFKEKLQELGYSVASFSKEIGIGQANVSRWGRSKRGVPKWVEIYLETKIENERLKTLLNGGGDER